MKTALMPEPLRVPYDCELCKGDPGKYFDFSAYLVKDKICDKCKNYKYIHNVSKIFRDGCPWCFSSMNMSVCNQSSNGVLHVGSNVFWAKCGLAFTLRWDLYKGVGEENIEKDIENALTDPAKDRWQFCPPETSVIHLSYRNPCSVISSVIADNVYALYEEQKKKDAALGILEEITFLTDPKYFDVLKELTPYRKENRPDLFKGGKKKSKKKAKKKCEREEEVDETYSGLEI